jgi:hypothetical protein
MDFAVDGWLPIVGWAGRVRRRRHVDIEPGAVGPHARITKGGWRNGGAPATVTTNPTIFTSALAKGNAYDEQLRESAAVGKDVDTTLFELTTADVRDACEVLRPVYDATAGVDGRVSIERTT